MNSCNYFFFEVGYRLSTDVNGKYTFTAPSADFTVNVTYTKNKKGCKGNISADIGLISLISIAVCFALKKGKERE